MKLSKDYDCNCTKVTFETSEELDWLRPVTPWDIARRMLTAFGAVKPPDVPSTSVMRHSTLAMRAWDLEEASRVPGDLSPYSVMDRIVMGGLAEQIEHYLLFEQGIVIPHPAIERV